MTIRRYYIGIESLSLTNAQKNTLVAGIQALGSNSNPNPCNRNHWRFRLDNNAAIFEAEFDDTQLTVAAFTTRLAAIFNVDPALITVVVTNNGVGTLGVFSYQAVQKLRIVLFGGVSATYQQSQQAALDYLTSNAASWEPVAA